MNYRGLDYDVSGSGDPLVLIHAGGLDRRIWGAQLEPFSRAHTVISFDARGAGRSDPVTTDFQPFEDVASLLRHLGVARAAIAGASLGGRTAIDFALTHPEMVSALVLSGAAVAGFEYSLAYHQMIVSVLGPLATGDVDGYIEAFLASPLGPRGDRSLTIDMLRDNLQLFTGGAAHIRTVEPPAIGRLSSIEAPALVLCGEEDHEDIRSMSHLLAAELGNGREIVVPGAAHIVNMDAPELFNRVVLEFLEEHRGWR